MIRLDQFPSISTRQTAAWKIHSYDRVNSTQDNAIAEARRIVSENDRPELAPCSYFSAHIAREQTGGRGQYTRKWSSPAGGLYASMVIAGAPEMDAHVTPLLAGAAVVQTIWQMPGMGKITGDIAIRWPNDVLLRGKKLAGILSECFSQGGRRAAVVGIGLNLNTRMADFPSEISPYAASLFDHTGQTISLESATRLLLDLIQAIWMESAVRRHPSICDEVIQWIAGRDYLHGKLVTISVDGRNITGRGAGISRHGELLLQTAEGSVSIISGTILAVEGEPVRSSGQGR